MKRLTSTYESSRHMAAIAKTTDPAKRHILRVAFSMLRERSFAAYADRCEREGRRSPFNIRLDNPDARWLWLESSPDDLRNLAKALELPDDEPGPSVILQAYAAALEKTDKQFRWRDINDFPDAKRTWLHSLAEQARRTKSPPTIAQWRNEFVRLRGKKSLPTDQSFRKTQKAHSLPLARSKAGPKNYTTKR